MTKSVRRTYADLPAATTPLGSGDLLAVFQGGRLKKVASSNVSGGGGGGGDLKSDGTIPLVANWDVGSFQLRALSFQSDVATGTPPLVVASSTKVLNLNADLLDGYDASAFAFAGGAFHDGFSDYVASEHIDWTGATQNFRTTGTISIGSAAGSGWLNVTGGSPSLHLKPAADAQYSRMYFQNIAGSVRAGMEHQASTDTLNILNSGLSRINIDSSGNTAIKAGNLVISTAGKGIDFNGGPTWTTGSGTPEGVVTAAIGSLFTRTDGGSGTTLYVKESGTGNTGWIGK